MKNQKALTEIRNGNVVIRIYKAKAIKNGRQYTSYLFGDYSQGTRKIRSFAVLDDAKVKAREVAAAIHSGQTDSTEWSNLERLEAHQAMEAVAPTDLSILSACQLFTQAVTILGGHKDLLAACQFWKDHRPTQPLKPKAANEAVPQFLAAHHASARRQRTIKSYLSQFATNFGSISLHDISHADLKTWIDAQPWKPKTRNEHLQAISQLYKEAARNNWVAQDCNPAQGIDRRKAPRGLVQIFTPVEAQQILDRLGVKAPELVPFFACWCFMGARKEELSRLNWPEVNRAVQVGHFELSGTQTKTGEPRVVAVTDNLRKWLELYRQERGPLLPNRWQSMSQLDDLGKFIARNTNIPWRKNAPRHSFGTYLFKLNKDIGETVRSMGNSITEFQRSYWNKAHVVTEKEAAAWFAIEPKVKGDIVPITNQNAVETHAGFLASESCQQSRVNASA